MKKVAGFVVGFRKFTVVVVTLLILAAYRYLELITGLEFTSSLTSIVNVFVAGNIGEHAIKAGAEYVSSKKDKA